MRVFNAIATVFLGISFFITTSHAQSNINQTIKFNHVEKEENQPLSNSVVQISKETIKPALIEGAKKLNKSLYYKDYKKIYKIMAKELNNLVENQNKLLKYREKIQKIAKNLSLNTEKYSKNSIKYLNNEIRTARLYENIKSLNKSIEKSSQVINKYYKAGIKFVKNNKEIETVGHLADIATVAINISEIYDAYKSGDKFRLRNKTYELGANTALIGGAGLIAAPLAIAGAGAIAVGSQFNEAAEEIRKNEIKDAKNDILNIDAKISNEALANYMENTLKNISEEQVSYTMNSIKKKLNKAFTNKIQKMIDLVNTKIKRINDQRMYVPFKGKLIRNQGQLYEYNWLIAEKKLLSSINLTNMPALDNQITKKLKNHYIDDLSKKYIKFQKESIELQKYFDKFAKLKINKDMVNNRKIKVVKKIKVGKKANETKNKIKEQYTKKESLYLSKKEKEVARLRLQNKKLTEEFIQISVDAKLNPKNKQLQQKFQAKKRELGDNAYKFLQLKKEIVKLGGKNPGNINGYASNSILTAVDKRINDLQQTVTPSIKKKTISKNLQTKLPGITINNRKTIKSRMYAYLLSARKLVKKYGNTPLSKWNKSDRVKIRILARNIGIKYGGDNITKKTAYLLAQIKRANYDAILDNALTANNKKIAVKKESKKIIKNSTVNPLISRKTKELNEAKRRLSNTQKYTYTTTRKQKKVIDRRKLVYLINANHLVQRYGNTPLSKWSRSDKVKLGILASNIGLRGGRNIIARASIFRALLRRGEFSYLRERYATKTEYYNHTTKHYNYDYRKLQINIAHLNSVIQHFKTAALTRQNNIIKNPELLNPIDKTDNFNDEVKQEIAYNTLKGTPGETESPILSSQNDGWEGMYTRNYYHLDNSGAIVLYGFGDSSLDTDGNLKPTKGSILHFYKSDDGTGTDRTRVLLSNTNDYFGDYKYVAWGIWSDPNADNTPDGSKIYTSNWEISDTLSKNEVPHQGNAVFEGELKGLLWKMGEPNTVHNANGSIKIGAIFTTNTVNGVLRVKNADTGANWASASFTTSLNHGSSGNALSFHTNLMGSDISNAQQYFSMIDGDFAGDQVAEAGGIWSITKGNGQSGDERATGVFRAKRVMSVDPSAWSGYITYNSEDKDDGKLRYWGGNFDSLLSEATLGGAPMFNEESVYKVDNGKITSVYMDHGENTSSDNTKEFHMTNNEIDKNSQSYNNQIKTLNLTRNLANGNRLAMKTTGSYDYTAWGEWDQTGGLHTDINNANGIEQMALHNNWVAGQITKVLPTQGSATYNGTVKGYYYRQSVGTAYQGKINGTMSMKVDFANTSIVSGVLNLKYAQGNSFATAHMSNMQMNRANSGFAGKLSGQDVVQRDGSSENMITGQFNGPHAEEVSGLWNVKNKKGQFADGVFAATQNKKASK